MGVGVRQVIDDCAELDKLATKIAKNHPDQARKLRKKTGAKIAKAIGRMGRRPPGGRSGHRTR